MFDERDDDPTHPGSGADGVEPALRDLALAFVGVGYQLSETARISGSLGGPERALAIRRIAAELGDLGDRAHDARRALWALAEQQR